jgi:hypothetical protein
MKGFKGFSKDWKCRNKQYEVGKTFEEPEARICKKGLHFCKHPLDVFRYYSPVSRNRFAEVEADEIVEDWLDDKLVCKKLIIKVELSLKEMIDAEVNLVFDQASWKEKTSAKENADVVAKGRSKGASVMGDRGVALATGEGGAASVMGYSGVALATGYRGAALARGDRGVALARGYRGAASVMGDRGVTLATGEGGAALARGDRGVTLVTGEGGVALATGEGGVALATGEGGAALATGRWGVALATGKNGLSSALGIGGRAKAALGNWITLAEWEKDEDYEWNVKEVKSAKIDGEILFPDIWYRLKDGKIVVCEETE